MIPPCQGRLVRSGNKFRYIGQMPDKPINKEKVYLIRDADMAHIMRGGELIVLQDQLPMNKEFYDAKRSIFPDQIQTTHDIPNSNRTETIKHFLDRHFYSYDTRKHLWLRYLTVDEALEQEV